MLKNQIINTIAQGKIAGSWIIKGAYGVGKKKLATSIANYVLTGAWDDAVRYSPHIKWVEKGLTDTAKREVQKLILAGKEVVQIDKTTARKNEITVDEVRDAIRFLSLKAGEGEYRILIVSLADEMNENAANALLKVLEEPNNRNIILLLTENPGVLLPTIKSRCRMLTIKPLSLPVLTTYIESNIPDVIDAVLLAELSNGSMGLAHKIHENEGLKLYQKMVSFLVPTRDIDISNADAFAESIKANDVAYDLFELFFVHYMAQKIKENASTMPKIADDLLDLYDEANTLFYKTKSVYLDKKQVVLRLIFKMGDILS